MYRKNFPGRRKVRQANALKELEKQMATPDYAPKRLRGTEPTKTELAKYRQLIASQIETLKKRIQEAA